LNRICLYADSAGQMRDRRTRTYLAFVDGIVAGEGMGPFANDPVRLGAVIAAWDPVAGDIAAADLMGFDYRRIPQVERALEPHRWRIARNEPDSLRYRSNDGNWGELLRSGRAEIRPFAQPLGWEEHLLRELAPRPFPVPAGPESGEEHARAS
jgi:hypothetical protein